MLDSALLPACYPWVKALHVIAVISWMAGMLYLPRLYVYHAGTAPGSEASEMLKIMERRLLRFIINPAMIATFVFGLCLLLIPGAIDWQMNRWIYGKLFLVFLLAGFHGLLARWRKDFERDENRRSAKFYKIANEIPTLLMIAIVILVVVKPF